MKDKHRIAAGTAPRASQPPGSPAWCYQTLNLLKDSYKHFNIDHKLFAQYLAELRKHKAWEKIPIDHPYGSESKMLIVELNKRIDEIEAQLKATRTDLRGTKAEALDDEDEENKEKSQQGRRTDFVDNIKNNIHEVKGRPTGTSVAAALRRLRKNRPDIHKRVLAGEITPHAGMVEAGFRKKRPSQKLTPFERVVKLLSKLSTSEKKRLKKML